MPGAAETRPIFPAFAPIYRTMSPTRQVRLTGWHPGPRLMLNDIYNKRIIELAGNIPRLGRLADPQASATAHSKLCGSTVKIDLKMDGPVVTDFAHDVKACALGQASSSIMARHVIGSSASELRELRETVRKMLKENGAPPPTDHKWADIALLEPVRDYKARPRLDHADLRCRGGRDRPDRGEGQAARGGAGLTFQ